MKFYIAAFAVLITGCATTETTVVEKEVLQTEPAVIVEKEISKIEPFSIESIITNQALKSYKNKYLKATSYKAFAQSESGAWNWKSNRTSAKHAMKSALVSCQVNNKKSENLYPCKVINVDGIWVE